MKIFVTVKPKAKIARVKETDATHFEVWVKEPAENGKANDALVRAMAEYMDIPRSKIQILRGMASRKKILEIA